MITKNDIILLLTELETKGIDISTQLNNFMANGNIVETLKFINERRPLDSIEFYNKVRKNYNLKKSNLYINIIKEIEDPEEVLTTLSAMLTQILLWSKKVTNKQMFLSSVRAYDISKVLTNYFKTWDIIPAIRLLRLIKADLLALETISGRRS